MGCLEGLGIDNRANCITEDLWGRGGVAKELRAN